MIETILETLGFKDEEIKTYLSLLDSGPRSGGDLAKITGIARPTIYGYLERLALGGLVSQSQRRGVKIFAAEPGEKIRLLYQRKIEDLKKKQKALDGVIPELEKRAGLSLFRPRMQFFEGQEGIQTLMQDTWQYENIESYTMWPIKSMRDIITPDFLYYHNKMRIRRKMFIKAIWQRDQALELAKNAPPDLGSDLRYMREIRLAPEQMKFKMGYWIYANKVAFISSRAESFGFLIESEELIQTLLAQHKMIWEISEPSNIRPKGEKAFFEEVDAGD
jgi:predicted transcriptional regulator